MRIYTGLDMHSDFNGRFPWSSRFIDHGGIRQAYVDEGPSTSGVTFVCLHGNPSWSFLYRDFIRRLSASYRVIAVDHVGFGRSDKPRYHDYYTISQHVENLSELLDHAGVNLAIPILHDWGGPIGMGWATQHPERVAGVVVLNTTAFADLPVPKLPFPFRLLGAQRAVDNNLLVEWFLGRLGTSRKMRKQDLDPYRAPFATPAERVGMAQMPNIYQTTLLPRRDPTWEPWPWSCASETTRELSRLRDKPALICWAGRDRAFRQRHLARWRATFENVDGPHMLEHARHFLQEDAGRTILDHIERWTSGKALRTSTHYTGS